MKHDNGCREFGNSINIRFNRIPTFPLQSNHVENRRHKCVWESCIIEAIGLTYLQSKCNDHVMSQSHVKIVEPRYVGLSVALAIVIPTIQNPVTLTRRMRRPKVKESVHGVFDL